ncbi:hypothetical protein HYPSUDRAFT_117565, partial [Hypholoma sublateritium FD-334 SS-4]
PMAAPPECVLSFAPMRETIRKNPSLFPIRTPINVSQFESSLVDHPNRLFVISVVDGLRNGFWPWCDPKKTILPYTLDAEEYLRDPARLEFALSQCAKEVNVGRFTEIPALLPGMMSVPCGVVPKGKDGKSFRLVVDHSAGPMSRNAWIDKSKVSVKLDGIAEFGEAL